MRATILMAHHLGIRVVAEGVEHDEQIRQLAALGCDLLQGYRIGRPMPAEDFVALLRGDGTQLAETLARALVRHALLVGDDPVQHGRIATRLTQTNWTVHRARDAAAALAVLAEQPVDLVLCDLELPDGDPLALLTDLRRVYPTVPRLLLAAHVDTPTLVDAVNRCGIYRCLPKPCGNTELDEAVAASYAHGLRRLRAEQSELRQG